MRLSVILLAEEAHVILLVEKPAYCCPRVLGLRMDLFFSLLTSRVLVIYSVEIILLLFILSGQQLPLTGLLPVFALLCSPGCLPSSLAGDGRLPGMARDVIKSQGITEREGKTGTEKVLPLGQFGGYWGNSRADSLLLP